MGLRKRLSALLLRPVGKFVHVQSRPCASQASWRSASLARGRPSTWRDSAIFEKATLGIWLAPRERRQLISGHNELVEGDAQYHG